MIVVGQKYYATRLKGTTLKVFKTLNGLRTRVSTCPGSVDTLCLFPYAMASGELCYVLGTELTKMEVSQYGLRWQEQLEVKVEFI